MARESAITHEIALLATGDEISNGDILNTNTQEIARRLFNHGMHIGMHLVTSDHVDKITQAMQFLLEHHDALIITGGLGPTSDDLTRYALGRVVNRILVFDELTWDDIVNRLKNFGYETPPESNRQQALFPIGSVIIPNPNGTAAGCMIKHNNKLIFMLPGPPTECLPMFKDAVLPELEQSGFQQLEYHKNWLLFGVSEGQIAEELDALAKPFTCTTGYRLHYPYLEFKLHSNSKKDFEELVPLIEKTITPFLIGEGKKIASELLQEELIRLNLKLKIADRATGGYLESCLKTPKTVDFLTFTTENSADTNVVISGLDEFWHSKNANQTLLKIDMRFQNQQEKIETVIPFRSNRVKMYAVEFISWKILNFLS